MTNKKFSIRKLAVGTASVAIGFSVSGTIDSTLANDYTNNYTVSTNTSNNYMYNSNNRNQPLSPEEYTLKQAKEKAITEVYNHNSLYSKANNWNTIENTVSYINKSQSEEEVSSLLQDFKNKSEKLLQDEIAKLKNLTSNDLLELNISATDGISLSKATILNELYTLKGLSSVEFKKYRSDIINPKRENGENIHDERELSTYLSNIDSLINTMKTEKSIFDAESISATTRSKIIDSFYRFNGNRVNPANKNELDTLSYSIKVLEKLSKNNLVPNIKKEGLEDELVTYLKEAFDFSDYTKAYHLLSVIRSLNEQYEIKNNINNESKLKESKTIPEYELSLSNKKVIAYDFLKGLTYPTLEKLRADIINATEEDIYSLSHKASAIKQINSIKALNSNDKERYINEILKADLRSDLSSIVGKVLENDIIETSNLSDKHKNRLKEILNSLPQTNYNTFSDIISSALAINESKDLSSEEKEAFFDEFINKYKSPINQDTPSLDYETLYKMDVSILINKLSYLTDEDKKLYKEKIFAQKPGLGSAGVGELEYRVGFFTKDKILKNSEYTL
ncbi:MAG: YSIRK-type signal peptide-containing protein, partial [Gemella haemolysans]|nr:YSIRK-type signal peptide-containing protein [Gemella haemolysans]